MATVEERVRILEMVQSGEISAEKAATLLKALEQVRPEPEEKARSGGVGKGPRQVRIRVTDLETGKHRANVTMPWSLLSVGVKMGVRFAHERIKLEDFMDAIQAGATGKIVDMVDEEDRERVEVFVE